MPELPCSPDTKTTNCWRSKRASQLGKRDDAVAVSPSRQGSDMEVYLSENAFFGLLVSTIEVFRRECFGILLGHSTSERVFVEFAVPYQTANRKYREVHMDWKRSQRVEDAVRSPTRPPKGGAAPGHDRAMEGGQKVLSRGEGRDGGGDQRHPKAETLGVRQ